MDALKQRALLFGVYIQAPEFLEATSEIVSTAELGSILQGQKGSVCGWGCRCMAAGAMVVSSTRH